jgi:hypothetical protein
LPGRSPTSIALIVGNETQLKATLPPNRLVAYLDQVRSALRGTAVQVSTAEPWHVWLAQPQLARHVDFIAIHVLPYWEKESIDAAVETSLKQIARVQARFPDRKVVIAEIGWPSNGSPLGKARASAANQALFVRNFLQQAGIPGARLLPDRGLRSAVEDGRRRARGRLLGHVGCLAPAQVPSDRPGAARPALAEQGLDRQRAWRGDDAGLPAGRAADAAGRAHDLLRGRPGRRLGGRRSWCPSRWPTT